MRFFVLVLFCFVIGKSWAVTVHTKISKNPVAVNEDFRLIIEVVSGKSVDIGAVELPKTLDPLVVKGSSQSTQSSHSFSSSGGMVSEIKNIFYYTLSCDQEGVWPIHPISITVDNKIYKTQSVEVEVSSQVQPSPQKRSFGGSLFDNTFDMFDLFDPPTFSLKDSDIQKDVKLKVIVPKRKIFIGEMLPVQFVLYKKRSLNTALNVESFPSIQPKGFWLEKVQEPQTLTFNEIETIEGEEYLKALLVSYVVFPLKTGTLKIDSLKLNVGSRSLYRFFSRRQSHEVQSDEISIQVSELPPVDQANFTGAVGEFLIQSELDQKKILKSDILSYKISFEGQGQVRGIRLPEWPQESDFKVYNVLESQEFSVNQSRKVFEVLLLAKKSGNLQIPRVNLTTFNPKLESYVTHELESQHVLVEEDGSINEVQSQKFFKNKTPETSDLSKDEVNLSIISQEDVSFYEKNKQTIWLSIYAFILLALLYRWRGLFIKKTRKDLGKILLNGCTQAMDLKNKGRYRDAGLALLKVIDQIWLALTGVSGREVSVLLQKCPPSMRQELGHSMEHLIQQIEFLSFAPRGSYRWTEQEVNQLIKECEMLVQRVLAYHDH